MIIKAKNHCKLCLEFKDCEQCWCHHREKRNHTSGRDVVRRAVLARDNNTCQLCKKVWSKKGRRFIVTFRDDKKVIARNYVRVNVKNSLWTLCWSCLGDKRSRLYVKKKIDNVYLKDIQIKIAGKKYKLVSK